MDLAKILKAAMKRDGRSQYKLAKDCGIAVAVIQRFSAGERDIRLATASKLCKALGLELKAAKSKT